MWPVMAAMAWCALVYAGSTPATLADPPRSLDQIERLRTTDHPRFAQLLAQFHREASGLTSSEQWHLRYLDAWEAMYEGHAASAESQLREVIDHSGDAVLATKASAVLLSSLGFNRRYGEAYRLANQLTAGLPGVKDPEARLMLLDNLSQMLNYAGQTDLAINYARMMESVIPADGNMCRPRYLQVAALYNGKRLTPASLELRQAIETCTAAREPIYTHALELVLDTLYLDQGQPGKALALLDRIAPAIQASRYYPQMLSAQAKRALAYATLGRDDEARKAALAVVAMSHPGDINEWLKSAYEVLYQVEKKQGHAAAALDYHERYVAQDQGHLNDVSTRTLAYQTIQQQALNRQLETEELSRQHTVLRMQQALDAKKVETGRLYVVLLLMALTFIVLWVFRLKRSQLRFMRLSHRDGLTGIDNHQHFIIEADRVLRSLEKKVGHACLVSIDLDHFKQVNDTHGHAMGDAVLKRAVAICQQHLRPTDLFGRLGGEEFGILLHECSRDQGLDIANRIRVAIGTTPIEEDGHAIRISASFGLAFTDISGYGLQQLCMEADAALYRAKRAGRNRVIAAAGNDSLVEA